MLLPRQRRNAGNGITQTQQTLDYGGLLCVSAVKETVAPLAHDVCARVCGCVAMPGVIQQTRGVLTS